MSRLSIVLLITLALLSTHVRAEKPLPSLTLYKASSDVSEAFETVSTQILELISKAKDIHPGEDPVDVIRQLSGCQQRVAELTKRVHSVQRVLRHFDEDKDIPLKFYSPRSLELEVLRLDLLNELDIVQYILSRPQEKPKASEKPREYAGRASGDEDVVEAEDDN